MTEMLNGMSQSQETASSQPVTSTQPVAPQAPAQAVEERSFRQSEVNDIVKRAKNTAVEDFKRLQSEQPQYFQQKYGESNNSNPIQQPANMPNEDYFRKLAAEEIQRSRDDWVKDAQMRTQEENAQRTAQNFANKISTGREKYQDFDQVVGDIDYSRFPNVVTLLGDYLDNSDSVLYHLGKNRLHMDGLESLANRSPKDAINEARRLSQSIKDNESASKMRIPNEPLSQMRPSNTGMDNGAMSVADFKRKYKV
jgi:hypothetical protein